MHFRAVAVDDDPSCLSTSLLELKKNPEVSEAIGFTSPKEALSFIKEHYSPVVLLDIRMPEMDGLSLAEKILDINPRTNIIFVTSYSHYLPQAFSLHASGYIMKPLDSKKLDNELSNLRFQMEENKMGFYAVTFGSFGLTYNGDHVSFDSEKDKEVMAYFVNKNGMAVTVEKISEDMGISPEKVEKTIDSLISMFSSLGEDGLLIKTKKGYFLDMSLINSDVSDALGGIMAAKLLFAGEYLSPYNWADERRKELRTIL